MSAAGADTVGRTDSLSPFRPEVDQVTTAFALSGEEICGRRWRKGTIVALIEAGVSDLLVGTSVGALNAAFLSTRSGLGGPRELVRAWSALTRREAVRINPLTALGGFLERDLISDQQLRNLIRRWVEIGRIEEAAPRHLPSWPPMP